MVRAKYLSGINKKHKVLVLCVTLLCRGQRMRHISNGTQTQRRHAPYNLSIISDMVYVILTQSLAPQRLARRGTFVRSYEPSQCRR